MRGDLTSASKLVASFTGAARVAAVGAALTFTLAFAPSASAETRTLKLLQLHTGERVEIAFKRNGVYLPDGLKKLNYSLRDWRRNEPTRMDPKLFDLIWEVYNRVGATGYINVVCGYRAPATNSLLRHRSKGVAEKSQHILGRAMDFFIPGVSLKKLRYTGLQMQVGGVGYYPTSGSPFVHMDVGNVRHWPGISRSELMAVFPDGKTIHIPSDGVPLKGYDVAMAAYKSRKAGGGGSAIASAIPNGKKRTFFQALFGGGGADESEDNAGDESIAVAAAAPKPVKQKPQAAPIEPDPTPAAPQQPVIVATLPRRDQKSEIEPPRPDADVNGQQPEVLAFAVPVPGKKPRFAAVQPDLAAQKAAAADQAVIAAAINAADPQSNVEPVVARIDPKAEEAAIAAALGTDKPVADELFIAGNVPVPGKKPKMVDLPSDVELASIAVPTPRPVLVSDSAAAVEMAALEPNDGKSETEGAILEQQAELQPAPDAIDDVTNEDVVDDAQVLVASVPVPTPRAENASASMRSTMLGEADASLESGVKTSGKGAKPKAKDAKPGIKAVATAPTPKVGKFALGAENISMANQPIAPEYAQALVREAPTEVYVAGFSKAGPLEASKFSGKSVNFLRIAKFKGTK